MELTCSPISSPVERAQFGGRAGRLGRCFK